MKSKSARTLYVAASIMFITAPSFIKQGVKFWPLAVVAAIPLILGTVAFIVAARRKDGNSVNEQTDPDYSFSTKQLQRLAISSFVLAVGQVLFQEYDENIFMNVVSSILIFTAFILMIFAMPRKHKAPLIFFLAFVVCLFIFLYFFEPLNL